MPFEYQPYRDSHSGTIADLMMAPAQAQARAAQASGEAWNGAAQQIGQSVANLPQQIQRQKAQQQEQQIRDLQLQGAQRQASDVAAVDKAYTLPTRDQILNALPGHLRARAAKDFADADEADLKAKKAKADAEEADADYFGALAAGVKQWNYDPQAAMLALSHAKAAGHDTSQIESMLRSNPTALPQIVDGLIAGSPKYSKLAQDQAAHAETARKNQMDEFMRATTEAHTTRDRAADNARQDAAAAETAQHHRALEKAAAAAADKKTAPLDVTPDIRTTASGRAYIDLSLYQGEERNKARTAANAAGAVPISKEQADALGEIGTARSNQDAILAQIQDLLPRNPAGRIVAAPTVKLEKLFQSNDQVAAFNSWRTAAINSLRATAGSKGLRINQAEIAQAVENDIPKLTDTLGTAQQKVSNIKTMLENAEKSILVRDQSPAKPTTVTLPDGQTATFPDQKSADAFKKAAGIP